MHCKNCKYWSSDDLNYPDNIDLGKCDKVKMFWASTEWGDEGQRVIKKDAQGDKAFVQDGSDYKAELITLGDFGCVQFEPR